MNNNKCCVIPIDQKNKQYIKDSLFILGASPLECQFSKYLTAIHQHNNEYFCILHLPLEAQQSQKKSYQARESFMEMLEKKIQNYNFITVSGAMISNIPDMQYLTFMGCQFWSLNINIEIIRELHFTCSTMIGTNYIKGTIDNLIIDNCDISSSLSIERSKIGFLFVKNSTLHNNMLFLCARPEHRMSLSGSEIECFRFKDNTCKITLELDNAEIGELDLTGTIFFLCPSFFNTDLSEKKKKVILPSKEHFNINKFIKQYSMTPNIVFKDLCNMCLICRIKYVWRNSILKKYNFKTIKTLGLISTINHFIKEYKALKSNSNIAILDQYRKFREIYNITKAREMFLEQGDFFYLMHRCLENSKEGGYIKRIASRLYRWSSNYGQDILKPLLLLFGSWLAFGFIYQLSSIPAVHPALLMSIIQLINPYSLLLVAHLPNYIYILGFLESSILVIFMPLLIIGLTWAFRKK